MSGELCMFCGGIGALEGLTMEGEIDVEPCPKCYGKGFYRGPAPRTPKGVPVKAMKAMLERIKKGGWPFDRK